MDRETHIETTSKECNYSNKSGKSIMSELAKYKFNDDINIRANFIFTKMKFMKSLSLKLEEEMFFETEAIINQLKLTRSKYIQDAIATYNQLNQRMLLKNQLITESRLVASDSLEVLAEFEMLEDDYQTI